MFLKIDEHIPRYQVSGYTINNKLITNVKKKIVTKPLSY